MKKALKYTLLIILVISSVFGGYVIGSRKKIAFENYRIKILDRTVSGLDLDLFYEVFDIIKKNYANSFDQNKVVEGSVRGLVDGLGDPHSVYFDPVEAAEFNSELAGEVIGIGIEVEEKNGVIVVVAPISGSPADEAGIKPGDIVLSVDGEPTLGKSLSYVVKKIRGKAGTTVKLQLSRDKEIIDLELTRRIIKVPATSYKIIERGIGYLKISLFTNSLSDEIKKAADLFNRNDVKVIILDLRNDPGGLLDEATSFLDEIYDSGTLVVEQKKDGSKTSVNAQKGGSLTGKKFVVLINGGSASSAEIVAGALLDNSGSALVGEKTFGKGSIQEPFNLSNGALLKITIGHWLTPKENKVDGVGISPSEEVKKIEDQLPRALEIAKSY